MQFTHLTHLFWPSDRKLFRQRSHMRRRLVPALAAVVAVILAVATGQFDWNWRPG